MLSQAFDRFQDTLQAKRDEPVFIEFLQQLFPWVSADPGAAALSESGISQIRWAIGKISSILYAAHMNGEGVVELIRGTPARPRSSWSLLLHDQNSTIRLQIKLLSLVLEVFSIARPEIVIRKYACGRFSHQNGVFNACWVFQHEDTAMSGKKRSTAMCSEVPPLVGDTCVFVQIECPQGQSHLPMADRDVLIKMRVEPMQDDDPPSLCSDDLSSVLEIQATVPEKSGILGTIVPATQQNAMSFSSNNKVETETVSYVAVPVTRQNAICFPFTGVEAVPNLGNDDGEEDDYGNGDDEDPQDVEGIEETQQHTMPASTLATLPCGNHRLHNSLTREKLLSSAFQDLLKVCNFFIINAVYWSAISISLTFI